MRFWKGYSIWQKEAEILFQKFAVAAKTANEELKQFKQLIDDDESKKIFEHARESRAQNPKGITPWRISEHPEWLNRKAWFTFKFALLSRSMEYSGGTLEFIEWFVQSSRRGICLKIMDIGFLIWNTYLRNIIQNLMRDLDFTCLHYPQLC